MHSGELGEGGSAAVVRGRSHIMSAPDGGGVSRFLIFSDKGGRGVC